MEPQNKLTKTENTPPALWHPSNNGALTWLKAGDFESLSKSIPNKVYELLDCEPIESLIKHAGVKTVQMYLETELTRLALNFNGNPALNLKDYQVPVIAEQLIENYKWESIEDFTLCFRRASAGLYGEIYRIDGAVIGQWFARYLDEKYDALEQRKKKEKHVEVTARVNNVVDGSKYIQQMLENLGVVKEEPTPREETEYQKTKLSYPTTPPEVVRQKELHIQYLREMSSTGKKKEEWISEETWLNNLKK